MSNNMKQGLIIGFIIPIISSPIVCWLVYFFHTDLRLSLYDTLVSIKNLNLSQLPSIISLCLIMNLIFFLFFTHFKQSNDRDEKARGVLLATFLYGVFIVVLKLL